MTDLQDTPDHRRPSGPLIAALALATVLLVVAVVLVAGSSSRGDSVAAEAQTPAGFRGNQLPPEIVGKEAPRFRLRDARGGYVDSRLLRGRPYVVTFLFTSCPDVCPLIGQEIRAAFEQLGDDASGVAGVGISVDPARDSSSAVRTWLDRQRLPGNFHYAIGAEKELAPVWKSYFAAPQIPGDPNSSHSASIWLIDARGRIRTKFSGGVAVPPADIAHDLRVLLDET
jgi:protein SCO1